MRCVTEAASELWPHNGYWHGEGDAGPGFGSGSGPGYGPGGWHGSEWRQAGQAAFDEFHRQAHGGSIAAERPAAGGTTIAFELPTQPRT
jgi:hypothetical protein